ARVGDLRARRHGRADERLRKPAARPARRAAAMAPARPPADRHDRCRARISIVIRARRIPPGEAQGFLRAIRNARPYRLTTSADFSFVRAPRRGLSTQTTHSDWGE